MKSIRENILYYGFLFLILLGITLAFGNQTKNNLADTKNELYEKLHLFADVLTIVKKNYVKDVSSKDLIYGALSGALHSLDAHSQFMDPVMYKAMKVDTEGHFGGLGIEITIREGILTVISPMEGTPAFNQGVKSGDKILKIDDKSTENITLMEAVKQLRGIIGTKVKVTILRPSTKEFLDIEITRADIQVHAIRDAQILPDTSIGYVRILHFQEDTSEELESAIKSFGEIEGLVLDLRNNPGGLLQEAVRVSELLVGKERLVVYTEGRVPDQNAKYYSKREEKIIDCPLVVLVNNGSASASEIVAGAVQDWKEGIILGVKSFGKGSVQSVVPLSDGSALRLTTARYFTPKGQVIHGKGIIPDVEKVLTKEDEEAILKHRLERIDNPEKTETLFIDSQLSSAMDLIKGISVFLDKKEVAEVAEEEPAA
ncbi:MAG: S41 family peptidase [Candidatus Aureabacteria bacterium]|nr:S41 family peptidase [Candidatus Auribacterota bacterium]